MATRIATSCLIISDTHGEEMDLPTQNVDVAIHCGDLAHKSELHEFRTTLQLLKGIEAPLKLVIPGNHDWTLDIPMFRQKLRRDVDMDPEDPAAIKTYGTPGEARVILEDQYAKKAGIVLLDEVTHRFELANDALLTVYASPFTPSVEDWGFEYDTATGHDFTIGADADIVMTHGPPKGILDRAEDLITGLKKSVGCPGLFTAVARSRPQLHCFGHMHNSWDAKMVTWRDIVDLDDNLPHMQAINGDETYCIESMAALQPGKHDSDETLAAKTAKLCELADKDHCLVSASARSGQTLFVNATLQASFARRHPPWIVSIDLPGKLPIFESNKRKQERDEAPLPVSKAKKV